MEDTSSVNINTFLGISFLVFILCGIIYFLFRDKFTFRTENKKTKKQVQRIRQQHKIDEFNQTLELLNRPLPQVRTYQKERDLYELFYKGIPDEYDLDGNLIKGIEPDAQKASEYLSIIISSPEGTVNDVLNLAKIYHYGMHKFDVDLDKAEDIYQDLKFHPDATAETRQIIKDALADINKIRVYTWLNLPLEKKQNPDLIERAINHNIIPFNNDIAIVVDNVQVPMRNTPMRDTPRDTTNHLVRNQVVHRQANDHNAKGYNDPQNTHNSQVLSTIRLSLDKLKESTKIVKSQEETFNEVRRYIYSLKDSDKKEDAMRSLNELSRNTTPLSSTDMTEMQALNLVWNRIHDNERFNNEVSKNLKENLFDELATMQEHGTTICATGRFTHIVDTLSGADNDVVIKPTYAINEEMMTKAAQIRRELMEKEPEAERNLLERGTSSKQTEFDTQLKSTITEKLSEDYVKTGILTDTNFKSEIGKWIEEI